MLLTITWCNLLAKKIKRAATMLTLITGDSNCSNGRNLHANEASVSLDYKQVFFPRAVIKTICNSVSIDR